MFPSEWIWRSGMEESLRFPFEGSREILRNYSQAWQDIFAISILDGKRDGQYLEIGANLPVLNNNTYLLSNQFNWSGVSIEYDPSFIEPWKRERRNDCLITADALSLDYRRALPIWFGVEGGQIDYLQLDIDPSINTLHVLKRMPLTDFRFSFISFETDIYAGDTRARDESREILSNFGYELIGRDVCVMFSPVSSEPIPFEDWWVDPKVVSQDKIDILKGLVKNRFLPQDLIFK